MIFASRGIATVRDVFTFFPRAYEDRTKMAKVDEVEEGAVATLPLTVVGTRKIPMRGRGRMMLEVRCEDSCGSPLILKYFYVPRGLEAKFTAGAQLIVTGQVKNFMNRPEIVHPEITWGASAAPDLPMVATGPASLTTGPARDFGRVVPVYVEIEGVPSRTLRKVLCTWSSDKGCAPRRKPPPPSETREAGRRRATSRTPFRSRSRGIRKK